MADRVSQEEDLSERIIQELKETDLNYVDSKLIAERLGLESRPRDYAVVGRCFSKLAERDDPPIAKWGSSSRPKWEVLVE